MLIELTLILFQSGKPMLNSFYLLIDHAPLNTKGFKPQFNQLVKYRLLRSFKNLTVFSDTQVSSRCDLRMKKKIIVLITGINIKNEIGIYTYISKLRYPRFEPALLDFPRDTSALYYVTLLAATALFKTHLHSLKSKGDSKPM